MSRVEIIGNATLYLGLCEDIIPTIGPLDAILSDPPYGQKVNTNVTGKGVTGRAPGSGRPYKIEDKRRIAAGGKGNRSAGKLHSTGVAVQWPQGVAGDDKPFEPDHLLKATKKTLLWGAHKFDHKLPRGRWLAWDKVPTGKIRDQGDGELAWTNVNPDAVMRIYRLLWDGVCVGSAARHEVTSGTRREHPTQKPEALMSWCLQFLELQPNSLICDPYMGAGSSGIAAFNAGHRFIGIEIEPLYFETACRRIENAQRQGFLFDRTA